MSLQLGGKGEEKSPYAMDQRAHRSSLQGIKQVEAEDGLQFVLRINPAGWIAVRKPELCIFAFMREFCISLFTG